MANWTRAERRARMLKAWAMRAADHINEMDAADIRAAHLGEPCDYAQAYMGHQCRCGHRPITWDQVYAHAIATMEAEGIE